jgi:hypothetical protein
MKNRPKKQHTKWRIIWYQLVDGVHRMKWHTGTFGEVEVLRLACMFAGEKYSISEPGSFKE